MWDWEGGEGGVSNVYLSSLSLNIYDTIKHLCIAIPFPHTLLGTQSFFVLRACAVEISIIIITLNTYDTSALASDRWAWPCECTVRDGDLRHLWTCGWPPGQSGPLMTPRRSNIQWRFACRWQCSIPRTFESGHQGLKIHVTIWVMFVCLKAYSLMYSENPHDHKGNVCTLQDLLSCVQCLVFVRGLQPCAQCLVLWTRSTVLCTLSSLMYTVYSLVYNV